jgi:GNAT superfamily N-acetyltransferase
MFNDGYTDVPARKIAAIVTHLRMLAPPVMVARSGDVTDISIRRVHHPSADWYRDLYRRVGENWLWFSRLTLRTAALEAIICHPLVEVYALAADGRDEGLLELDFRTDEACELAFFGVTPALIGRGAGRLLMNHAIEQAWQKPIRCFWVHTCTFDHPGAIAFYLRSGFHAFKRQIEIADDPRLNGSYPPEAAPHVPVIRGS